MDARYKGEIGREYLEIIPSSSLHSVAPGCLSCLPDGKAL